MNYKTGFNGVPKYEGTQSNSRSMGVAPPLPHSVPEIRFKMPDERILNKQVFLLFFFLLKINIYLINMQVLEILFSFYNRDIFYGEFQIPLTTEYNNFLQSIFKRLLGKLLIFLSVPLNIYLYNLSL